MMLRTTVKYRVYWVILRRPSSPSFCRRSRYGNTTVINCKMMDEVMYGIMPSAKIVRRRKLPPLKRSKIPSAEFCACWKYSSRTSLLIPGVGICAPRRYTANKASVKRTRFRRSSMRKRFESAWRNRFMRYLVSLQSLLQDRKTNSKATARKSTGLKTRHYNCDRRTSYTERPASESGPYKIKGPTTSSQNLE